MASRGWSAPTAFAPSSSSPSQTRQGDRVSQEARDDAFAEDSERGVGPRPRLFAIGRFVTGRREHALPSTYSEVERDAHYADRVLSALGLGTEAFVVIVGMYSEAPFLYPFQEALFRRKVPCLCIDDTESDAVRLLAAFERLPVQGVIGLGAATLTGVRQRLPSLGERLNQLAFVAARPDAWGALERAGVFSAVRMALLGPAVAIECRARVGLHVDPDEWAVGALGQEVVISNRRARAFRSQQIRTGLLGTIVESPCSCELEGPRVIPRSVPVPDP